MGHPTFRLAVMMHDGLIMIVGGGWGNAHGSWTMRDGGWS